METYQLFTVWKESHLSAEVSHWLDSPQYGIAFSLHWSMQIFFCFCNKALILRRSLTLSNTNTVVSCQSKSYVACILLNMQYHFPNHWSMKIFFNSVIRSRFSNFEQHQYLHLIKNESTSPYIAKMFFLQSSQMKISSYTGV